MRLNGQIRALLSLRGPQDVYLGFKLFDLGLFLQPRRKLPLRLGFYNATFGVWEQWTARFSHLRRALLAVKVVG